MKGNRLLLVLCREAEKHGSERKELLCKLKEKDELIALVRTMQYDIFML